MKNIILIAHDIRSAHNVGSLLRTADCLGASKVIFTGYTPYPKSDDDKRLPYIAEKLDRQIHKTALGAEKSIDWEHEDDIFSLIETLKKSGYEVTALEQNKKSINLKAYRPASKIAIIIGREREGIDKKILSICDRIVEIPMKGAKESLNVAAASAIAIYVVSELLESKH